MNLRVCIRLVVLACLMTQMPWLVRAQTKNFEVNERGELIITPSSTSSPHDFDFFVGKWSIHHKKLKSRLTKSTEWIEYEGTNEDVKMLSGIGHTNNNKAIIDGKPVEGVSLTLFDPQTRLWVIYWANSTDGELSKNPVRGSFDGNIGHFYAKDVWNGKPILVMAQWDKTNPDQAIWSQAFSDDNGKSWEWNWHMTQTRVVDEQLELRKRLLSFDHSIAIPDLKFDNNGELIITPSPKSSGHDFDFLTGRWTMYHKKLKSRLSNNNEWIDLVSEDVNYGSILNGLGNTDLYKAVFDGKPFEGFTLRLFSTKTRLWSLYWVASNSGVLDPPVVGSFEGEVGHFFCKDTFKGKEIIVVFRWDKRNKEYPVWSQAFSADRGKTWEWNWINVSERVK